MGIGNSNETLTTGISRRTVTKGIAWAAPAVAIAGAAPAYAASLRKDPDINGWVLNSPTSRGNCRYYLEVNSNVTNVVTPDRAPFGLYLYDIEDDNASVTAAKLTYWIIGNQQANWETYPDHSGCWGSPVRGTPQNKADGFVYTPYTWTYNCAINAGDRLAGADGIVRLWLGHFHVRASFTQPSARCNDVTYWTQRTVTVDRDGPGGTKYDPEVLTFERRNGTRGTFNARTFNARARSAALESSYEEGQAMPAATEQPAAS